MTESNNKPSNVLLQVLNSSDKLTPSTRTVLDLSSAEARSFNHNYIGTEHLLLGLIREENVITCRLNNHDLDTIDALVEAGIRSNRSDAASWLIRSGVKANQPLFQKVTATVHEIRRLREEAQVVIQQTFHKHLL